MSDLLAFDREHLWHPYSSATSPLPVFPVASAEGVRIRLADGRELVDGMASWWSAIHGYNHPVLNRAITEQLESVAHIMFGGLTHQPAVELAKLLLSITPPNLQKIFYADSGSVAVEVAIKMALQYWQAKGLSKKNRLLALMNGYHGDTFGAMSVTDPINGMHHIFTPVLPKHIFAPSPSCRFGEPCTETDFQPFADLLEQHSHELAAVILEPVVQGAGGMKFYSPDFLRRVREACNNHHVLLIADEIATGFGRTGELFACNHAEISPDILCLGKALSGGYMSFAATLCTHEIANGISACEAGVFMHGPTFMANPLACAVSIASIRLLLEQDWRANIHRMEQQLANGLAPARNFPQVADVRVLGAIGVIEMKEAVDMKTLQPALVDAGIWVRPFGKLVYLMPPYVTSNDDLRFLTGKVVEVVEKIGR